MGQLDLFERGGADIRRMARLGQEDLPFASEIACSVLGAARLTFGAPGTGTRLEGLDIVVDPTSPDINHEVAHELGEWWLRDVAKVRLAHVARERAANRIAAALLAPPDLVRRCHRHYGDDFAAIAETFAISQTSAALRLGEVLRDERAVVTRSGFVFIRSQGGFPWAPELARWAAVAGIPGVVKARLAGGIDAGRVALRAA